MFKYELFNDGQKMNIKSQNNYCLHRNQFSFGFAATTRIIQLSRVVNFY